MMGAYAYADAVVQGQNWGRPLGGTDFVLARHIAGFKHVVVKARELVAQSTLERS